MRHSQVVQNVLNDALERDDEAQLTKRTTIDKNQKGLDAKKAGFLGRMKKNVMKNVEIMLEDGTNMLEEVKKEAKLARQATGTQPQGLRSAPSKLQLCGLSDRDEIR